MPTANATEPARPSMFADDGVGAEQPRLPFLVYRGAIDLSARRDPADG